MKRVRVTVDIFKQRASQKHGNKYDYSTVSFDKVHDTVSIICPEHGVFQQKAYSHLAGIGCPKCGDKRSASKRSTPIDEVIKKATIVHSGRYQYRVADINSNSLVVICPEHGEFNQSVKVHLRGSGCPACNRGGKMSKDEWVKKARVKHGDKYDYTYTNYLRIDQTVSIRCPVHGDFEQLADVHVRQGSGCPKCSNSGVSKAETEVFNFVRSICPDAVQSDRTTIGPLELDVVVPSRNLAIEFNGLYWHDERTKDKKYHITKRHRVEAAGYRLISIREDVWNERREQVENIIRNALGVTSDKVFARKCNIVEVSTSEAKVFMEKHHVQGFRGATVHYGLQHDDTLVAVISLTNWQKKNEWELVRYATACNVPGGLSRLWKHATTVNSIVRAYSYVDRDLFSGSSYTNAGFTLSATTVGFRIVNGCTTESREKWNRAPDGMTQTQWYESEGVSRIYDSGQDKLLWVK